MPNKIIMANFKLNGSHKMFNDYMQVFVNQTLPKAVDIAFFLPAVYLDALKARLMNTPFALGGQTVSEHECGAFTGEISASMLKDCGCQYGLVGHSERRTLLGEDNQQVAQKAEALVNVGIKPVVCVGESLAVRESGQTNAFVAEQLDAVLRLLGEGMTDAVIAYEPIWAIGTGVAATTKDIQAVHAFLRDKLTHWHKSVAKSIRIVYGGSVKSTNAADILKIENVDGALVGGASLDPISFAKICAAKGD